jgi:aarF domain-containing kinase
LRFKFNLYRYTAATALGAIPEPVKERVSAAAAAVFAALPPQLTAAAADAAHAAADAAHAAAASPGAAAAAAAVFLAVAPRLLPGKGGGDSAGMDEWAALAAKEGDDEPAELQQYNPEAIQKYFAARPITLIRRGVRSGSLLGGFGFSLWLDRKVLGEEPDEKRKLAVDDKRAIQLRDLLISLGPTYVKLGQVLSSRQDLLPAPYIRELRTLQDSVPPFNDDLARRILAAELGPAGARGLVLGDEPIASASLGQVYRGTLKDGAGAVAEVAVKVQRPGALVAISLDICIIRFFAEPWRKFQRLNTDFEGLVDEWGIRFVEELDYIKEAENGERFRLAMESRPDLAGVVTAAPVQRVASTRRVLTTGWINGQRLDTSEEGDVPRLCAVALASYLAMLLDIGVLHADPHPGNLFRTDDGRGLSLAYNRTRLISAVLKPLYYH